MGGGKALASAFAAWAVASAGGRATIAANNKADNYSG